MEGLEYDKAIENYYTLKAKYDKAVKKARVKINFSR